MGGLSPSAESPAETVTGDSDLTREIDRTTGAAAHAIDAVALRIGQQLGRYVVLRELGSGGMAIVYDAYDSQLDRRVALKLMRPGRASKAAESANRLQREARALARLSHPNVVHVYDVGTFEQHVYLAMELVDGMTLREWLRAQERPLPEILRVLCAAGRGLSAAHEAGLVHRDFKPSNVLIGEDGRVCVVDFGLAREPRSQSSREAAEADAVDLQMSRDSLDSPESSHPGRALEPLTEHGTIMGTPGYMAPEQLRGHEPDPRSDQFAFCVAAWEALYGQRPFQGETRRSLDKAILRGKITEPPSDRAVSNRIRKVLLRGLSVRPEDRHPGLDELLDQLRPRSSRAQTWFLGGLAAISVAAATGWGVHVYGPGASKCQRPTWPVWAEHRDAVQATFSGTKLPYADDAFADVDTAIANYVASWQDMHVDACEATQVRGEQSAELLDMRMLCLRQHQQEVDALVDVLEQADPETVRHAQVAVEQLPKLEECADAAALRSGLEHPVDPQIQPEVDAIDLELARALALFAAGQYVEAETVTGPVLERARALGHEPTVLRALRVRESVLTQLGRGREAEALLDEALWAAERMGADHIRADLLTERVFMSANVLGEGDKAAWFADAAEAALTRIDASDDLWIDLTSNRAVAAALQGEYEEALKLCEQALALRHEAGLPKDNFYATILGNMGSMYFSMGRYDDALSKYREELSIRRESLGPNHPGLAGSMENIGNTLTAMGQFEAGIEQQLAAVEHLQRAKITDGTRLAALLNNVAVSYNGIGEYEQAERYWLRAHETWERFQVDHPAHGIVLCNLGEIDRHKGEHEVAMRRYQDAQRLLTASVGAEHQYTAVALTGIGRSLVDLKRYDEAIAPLRQAVAVQASQTMDPAIAAETQFHLARALWEDEGTRDEARGLVEQAVAALREQGRGAEIVKEVERWMRKRGMQG